MKAKNKINRVLLMVAALSLISTIHGCGKKDSGKYGQGISNYTLTKIDAILKDAKSFEGKTVTVEGKIITECPAGGWFDLADRAVTIYVDLHPSDFAIPQKIGGRAIVEGKVKIRNNKPMIVGTGVELK
ncbi:MAG: hypothetical protein JW947_05480 [Sedimentisphaerales bacterium]|nr:hypothetical protein [Sedimentisphaerales bacterium]